MPTPSTLALIGCGRWGSTVARKADGLPAFRVVSVYDPTLGAMTPLLRDLPDAMPAASIEHACKDAERAIIATPPESDRVMQLAQVLQAGVKHVRIEKPMALSVDDARDMLAMANSAGAHLTIGHTSVYNALVPTLIAVTSRLRKAGALDSLAFYRLCTRGPAHAATSVWDLSSHDVALHRVLAPWMWAGGPPEVVDAGTGDRCSWFTLEDGSRFTSSHDALSGTRGIVINGEHYYNEQSQMLRLGGQMLSGSHHDPLGVELYTWAQNRVFQADIALEIVAVCEQAQRMIGDRMVQSVVG